MLRYTLQKVHEPDPVQEVFYDDTQRTRPRWGTSKSKITAAERKLKKQQRKTSQARNRK